MFLKKKSKKMLQNLVNPKKSSNFARFFAVERLDTRLTIRRKS